MYVPTKFCLIQIQIFNRFALESNFFPVIYNSELRVLDLWLSDCLDVEISEKCT